MEIHPETPPEGALMTARFRAEDIKRMMEHLRAMGAPFGITFVDRPILSNSRPALLAAEFAREQGKFQSFHEAVFPAYFSHGLDIGSIDVLKQIATDAGLDADAMADAVAGGKHLPLLETAKDEAARLGVTGVPTFFIDDKRSIVGAQSLDVFRKTLRSR
jgi:predicted DsbA family dithiol-disulfide isomerase